MADQVPNAAAPKEENFILTIGFILVLFVIAAIVVSFLFSLPRFALGPFVRHFFSYTWWLFLCAILLPVARSTWLFWRQELFKHSGEFTSILLELKVPREVHRSPRAMEQLLMTIHALRNEATDLRELYWDGEVTRWYSLEIVSFGGEIHMYIRTYYKQKGLVEAAFFSYYPDMEIVEVDDYVDRFPENVREMDKQGYDLWGGEMILAHEDAYPIRSYLAFESPDEEKQYDPISAFLEALGRIRKEEMVAVQYLISPASPKWKDKWEKLIENLRSKAQLKQKENQAKYKTTTDFPGGPLPAFAVEGGEDKRDPFTSFMRTPGEADVLKAVENNLSKQGFKTVIRFLYFSPVSLFYDSFPRRGILGAFNQYAALDMNFFKINYPKATKTKIWTKPYVFPTRRNLYRKERILQEYKQREMPHETFMGKFLTAYLFNWNFTTKAHILTTESLATLFHLPTALVLTAPHMKRVESRKAGPPAGLAIFGGGEKEIEKYL